MDINAAGGLANNYSARLGLITPLQFQAALSRFDLGAFVEATPVTQGLFGQNVFVTSTRGQYVLRGVPHYPWQFPKERFGAALLHQRTDVPVAYPYLLDPETDIFGWSYLLFPRMPGVSATDGSLTENEQVDMVQAMGHNLAKMHALTLPFAGHYDLECDAIKPFPGGLGEWLVGDVQRLLGAVQEHGAVSADDVVWVNQVVSQGVSAVEAQLQPCFVMNDYNPNNMVVDRVDGEWRVTGLFDLMEYYFGDGEADLVRLIASHLDAAQPQGERLARAFGRAYLDDRPPRPGFAERFELFMLRDRLIVWEYGTRPEVSWFSESQSFRAYAERYLAGHRLIFQDVV